MIKTQKYAITGERLSIHELIGLDVNVVQSKDSNKKGIRGTIVDETQRTFVIETINGEKTVPKNESVFSFELGDESVSLNGATLLYTPIERLKNGGTILYV